ncbi:4-carboxy-4-hydroxy-2-oxoadipate aldolase/oxaloacetate decarboxylase [Alicyclobacillus sp. ALC3]|uniref:4-carboxy-4-hydroxy-2-oxoadipate aldolase/oxaloacetate decarboxylase n=1 Tax=Alicyclobacillus sp. ALC3 TaxID=2796143 RepID=UPI002378E144|nr:4-carboxy-4-hydroxy-2-oxoadipate aldolase/oxaloacetate decarboxylase [Alicyclobacillus sp. ALC3]WDL97666.1 4-carboxy-4-hydroxy-2-oxoadipate aldolase/oxaloacetate decarboxylase [Alicyclobacillus sp. ALC3]
MSHRIVKNITRPNQVDIEKLGELGVATVHEAMGRTGLLSPYLRPVDPKMRVCGTAVTISSHPGDNLMIHAAIEVCQPGDVLVVTVTSNNTDGMFGELLAVSARAHGVRGLVIDAGVRDTAEITDMNFPVWSKAISAKGTVKATPGSVNVPVVCAGTLINPGDVIIADADGVVCVPKAYVPQAVEKGQARVEKENMTRARLAAGELGLDIYNLRPTLKALGVVYVEESNE